MTAARHSEARAIHKRERTFSKLVTTNKRDDWSDFQEISESTKVKFLTMRRFPPFLVAIPIFIFSLRECVSFHCGKMFGIHFSLVKSYIGLSHTAHCHIWCYGERKKQRRSFGKVARISNNILSVVQMLIASLSKHKSVQLVSKNEWFRTLTKINNLYSTVNLLFDQFINIPIFLQFSTNTWFL